MVLEKAAPTTAADQPAPVTPVQRTLQRLRKSRGKIIACVTVVVLVIAAVVTAFALADPVKTPTMEIKGFHPVNGPWELQVSSIGPKAVQTSTSAVVLRVINPNRYGGEFQGVKVRVITFDPVPESLDIANGPLPDMPDSIGVPPGENATGEVALPIKVEWPLTAAMQPARALAVGLFECGVDARKLPATLRKDYWPSSSDAAIKVIVTVRKVLGRNGVRIAEKVQYVKGMPASSLLCPDKSTQPGTWNQTDIERLAGILSDAWNTTKTA
ncbi:hypothetical protein GGF32_008393 [Allomyces javanicus]|nr:hypothetical protein GGF32_008393 [Allomyces javanicus]